MEAIMALLSAPFVLFLLGLALAACIAAAVEGWRSWRKAQPIWWVGFAGPMTYDEAVEYARVAGAPKGYEPEASRLF